MTLVAGLAFAGTASASPGARDMVASVFTSVTRGLGLHGPQGGDRAFEVGTLGGGASPSTDAVRGAPSVTGGPRGETGSASSTPSDGPAEAGGSTIADPGAEPVGATTVTAAGLSSSIGEPPVGRRDG